MGSEQFWMQINELDSFLGEGNMADRTVTVTDNTTGKKVDLPIHDGTNGPSVIDIGKLYKELGYFTFDPGFVSTGSCNSTITFIDGDIGLLRYRGYPIEQLAEKSTFLEVCYLLLYGELPNNQQFEAFTSRQKMHTMLDEKMRRFYLGFHNDAHPMACLLYTSPSPRDQRGSRMPSSA